MFRRLNKISIMIRFHINHLVSFLIMDHVRFPCEYHIYIYDDGNITLSIKIKNNSSYSNHNPKQKVKTGQQIYTNANVNILTCQKTLP